jgi:hypothetical protein
MFLQHKTTFCRCWGPLCGVVVAWCELIFVLMPSDYDVLVARDSTLPLLVATVWRRRRLVRIDFRYAERLRCSCDTKQHFTIVGGHCAASSSLGAN